LPIHLFAGLYRTDQAESPKQICGHNDLIMA